MYKIIYSDPPWQYGSKGPRGGKFGELDYPTMSIKELCKLDVASIADPNCVLFMWFTGSFMGASLEVAKAWGFKFIRIDKVWQKTKESGKRHAAVGPWGMSDCEFLALFVRGQMCNTQIQRNQYVHQQSVYPGKHSKKPEIFRTMIDNRFPDEFNRVEMFARETTPGWDVFGNEVFNSIQINNTVTLKSIFSR